MSLNSEPLLRLIEIATTEFWAVRGALERDKNAGGTEVRKKIPIPEGDEIPIEEKKPGVAIHYEGETTRLLQHLKPGHGESDFEIALQESNKAAIESDLGAFLCPKLEDLKNARAELLREAREASKRGMTGLVSYVKHVEAIGQLNSVVGQFSLQANEANHSGDFTSVNWFGTHYDFAKGNQAETVRVLWEACDGGKQQHSLSQKTIGNLVSPNIERFKLKEVFRRKRKSGGYEMHPAWGTMIQKVSKGCYGLVRPE